MKNFRKYREIKELVGGRKGKRKEKPHSMLGLIAGKVFEDHILNPPTIIKKNKKRNKKKKNQTK